MAAKRKKKRARVIEPKKKKHQPIGDVFRGKRKKGKPAKAAPKKKRPLREPVKKAKKALSKPAKKAGARSAVSTPQKLHEFGREVKRKAPPVRAKPETKAQAKRRRGLSKTHDAIRARKRRAEDRALAEAIAVEREARRVARNEKARARRRKAKAPPPTERELSLHWLERIRNDAAEIEACSLEIVEPRAGDPNMWFTVGRFDFVRNDVDYRTMGAILERIRDDIELEALIHPMRLSQVRVQYHDPKARGGEADGTISSIGAWTFILGELTGEILGADGRNDDDALAVRYEQSAIGVFWIYFAAEIRSYSTAPIFAGQKTVTVPLKR